MFSTRRKLIFVTCAVLFECFLWQFPYGKFTSPFRNAVTSSNEVTNSNGVTNSHAVTNSSEVTHSNGVTQSTGVTHSNSVTNSNAMTNSNGVTNSKFSIKYKHKNTSVKESKCPDVGMMKGRWRPRPLTPKEEKEIESFLQIVRTGHGLPKSLQRSDGRCGSVTFNIRWFRAVCNPKGTIPCCYNGKCVKRTTADCQCPSCYDMRSRIHAEYATWIPKDPRCRVKNFTPKDACGLLQGTRIIVVGDSIMRQLYTALLILLSNYDYGQIWDPKFPKELHKNCTGLHIFGEKHCRWSMRRAASFCHGSTSIHLLYTYRVAHKHSFHSYVRKLINKNKTFLLVGTGVHDGFNKSIYKEFMLPALQMIQKKNISWPKMIWATNHQFGLLKSPVLTLQTNARVREFNDFMVENLRKHDVPILDTFNMTGGVMSPDGAHYGLGVNVMKVRMFLNLLQQLKDRGRW